MRTNDAPDGGFRDVGDCRHCGVSLHDRAALSHGKGIWLCEACYAAVRDAVDAALDQEATR
jgi:ribosomal protein L37AE/L43A